MVGSRLGLIRIAATATSAERIAAPKFTAMKMGFAMPIEYTPSSTE